MNLKLKESITTEKGVVYRPGNLLYGADDEIRRCMGFSSTVIDSLSMSLLDVVGLGWDGEHLLACLFKIIPEGPIIRKVQKHQGFSSTVIDVFEPGLYLLNDITWGDSNLYIAGWDISISNSVIWKYKGFSGEVDSCIYTGSDVYGLAFDGKNLYSTCSVSGTYKINKHRGCTGTINKSFTYPYTMPCGLAWDGENICISDYESGWIYQQKGFSVTSKAGFYVPDIGHLGGLAWEYSMGTPRARFISRLFPVQDGARCSYPRSGYCVIISLD